MNAYTEFPLGEISYYVHVTKAAWHLKGVDVICER